MNVPLERETTASLARRCRGDHRRVRALRHRAVRSRRRLDRRSGGTGRRRAHPSLVALLQPRSVVGTDRRGPADRAGRRHDAGLRTSLDRRRHVGGDVVHVPASCDRPAIPGRGGHPVPAILAPGSTGHDGGGDSPGQRNVGPRAHRRNRGAGQPAARLAMDADRGGEAAHRGARRNAPVTGSANGAPTNGFIVGKRRDDAWQPRVPNRRAGSRCRPPWRQSCGADSVARSATPSRRRRRASTLTGTPRSPRRSGAEGSGRDGRRSPSPES